MSTPRQGGDNRPSASRRRQLARELLNRYGDGDSAPCWLCGGTLTLATVERDRIHAGGSYVLPNLLPAGRKCNSARGKSARWSPPHRGYCAPIIAIFPWMPEAKQ